jgi:hypothetical protein
MSQCFVYRLIPPRPSFDLDMTEEEQAIMGRHASYWGTLFQTGKLAKIEIGTIIRAFVR